MRLVVRIAGWSLIAFAGFRAGQSIAGSAPPASRSLETVGSTPTGTAQPDDGTRRADQSGPIGNRSTRAGTITGRLGTEGGDPLPGVEVIALPVAHAADLSPIDVLSLGEDAYLERSASEHAFVHSHVGRATTDRRGEFVISNLADLEYEVRFEADGWIVPPEDRSGPLRTGDDVEVTAYASHEVDLEVRGVTGALAPTSFLQLDPFEPTVQRWTWESHQASLALPRASRRLQARFPGGYDSDLLEIVPRSVGAMMIREPVTYRLLVELVGLQPGQGCPIEVTSPVDGSTVADGGGRSQGETVTADATGASRASFSLLGPGPHTVDVPDSYTEHGSHTRVVEFDEVTHQRLRVVMTEPPAHDRLTVQARGPDGPLRHLWVRFTGAELENGSVAVNLSSSQHRLDCTTPGVFHTSLRRLGASSDAPPVDLTLEVSGPAVDRLTVEATYDEGWIATVEFPPTVQPRIEIEGLDDPTVRDGLSVELGGESRSCFDDGPIVFPPVSPGVHRVRLERRQVILLDEEITFTVDDPAASLTVPRLYRLTVVVPPHSAGRRLQLQRRDFESDPLATARADARGIARFPRVPSGAYRLIHAGGQFELSVRSDSEIGIDLHGPGPDLVRVVKSTPTPDFDLRRGDVLRTVNGAPIGCLETLWQTIARAPSNETLRLGVERGGRELEVLVPAEGSVARLLRFDDLEISYSSEAP